MGPPGNPAGVARQLCDWPLPGPDGQKTERKNHIAVTIPPTTIVAPPIFTHTRALTEELAPDLVVEVKSPSNSNHEMADRAMMWLSHGVQMVLVADPRPVTLTVYRPGEPPQVPGEFDTFEGGDALPGFTAPVWSFFRRRP